MKVFRVICLVLVAPAMIFGWNLSPTHSMPLATAPVIIHVPGDAANLQVAVNTVSDGGIIELAAGTYDAPAGGGWIFNNLGKGFTIRAASGATVILSGGGTTSILRIQNELISAGKPIIFRNLIFENGYTQTEGLAGGLTLSKALATCVDCTFRNNTTRVTTSVGGGVYVANSSQVFFINTLWQDNISYSGGAGLGVRFGSKVYIHNSRFIHNLSNPPNHLLYASGGGIAVGNSMVRISNTVFENNQAAGFGAGLYIIGTWTSAPDTTPQSDVIIANSLFLNNEAKPDPTVAQALPSEGGGINIEDQSILKIYNTRLIKNRAMIGGGLNIFRATVEVYNSAFLGNQANGQVYTASFGGSISINSTDGPADGANNRPTGKVTVEDTLFQGHYGDVTAPASQVGGCLSASGDGHRIDGDPSVPDVGTIAENRAVVSLNRVIFDDCDVEATDGNGSVGGAIQVALTDLSLQNSLVMRSDALGQGIAGGVAALYNSNANISRTVFAYNTAGQFGGGLFMQGSTVQVDNSRFYGNEVSPGVIEAVAQSYGAAIFMTIDEARNLPANGTIQNSIFSSNIGIAIFDDDRTNGPINAVVYNNNQFYTNNQFQPPTDVKAVYRSSMSAPQTASGLNSLVITRSNGTSTDKSPANNNIELSTAPKLGGVVAGPANILTTNAAGETPFPPTLAYLGYSWIGASATLDGQAVSGNAGVSSANVGTHTLSVGGTNFTASIYQAPTPAATFTASGSSPVTLGWSVTAGTFLDVAIDHGVTIPSTSSGSVQISPPVDTDYWLYVITKEGGIVKSVNTGLPILNVPSTINTLAGLNYPVNKGYFNIKNDGASTLQWTATSQTPSLITMDTPTGETTTLGTIAFTMNVGSLSPGDHVGTIYVDAGPGGTALVTVNVKLVSILYKIFLPLVIR
ncbi:MAG: hypothetical protein Q8L64_01395 [bacterium]|nr:hypothetical protein [bacterium]